MIHVHPQVRPPRQKRSKWHEKRKQGWKERRKEKAGMEEWENTEKGKKTNDKANPPLAQLPLAASG